MFRTFGYRYVFDASAQTIREQLDNSLVETPVLHGVRWRIGQPEQTQVAIVVAPLQCFLAVLRLCDDPLHAAAVMLPPPGVGVSFYDGLAENQPRHIQRFCALPMPYGFFPFVDVRSSVLAHDTNEKTA
jgi:hypothetical protein